LGGKALVDSSLLLFITLVAREDPSVGCVSYYRCLYVGLITGYSWARITSRLCGGAVEEVGGE